MNYLDLLDELRQTAKHYAEGLVDNAPIRELCKRDRKLQQAALKFSEEVLRLEEKGVDLGVRPRASEVSP